MFLRLFFLLTLIPILEIYFLFRLTELMGWQGTFALVLLTGFVGASLLRRQGHSILMEMQMQTTRGQLPSDSLTRGFFTFVGGLLLLTPGVLTDFLGLSLIFPPTQFLWKKYFAKKWQSGVQSGRVQVFTQTSSQWPPRPDSQSPYRPTRQNQVDTEVIDVEVVSSKTQPSDNS
jgi:UPF0716 protein FxsA